MQKDDKHNLTRSEVMAKVRSRDTGPELVVRKALWSAGLRYRLYDKKLPGRPDIVFPSRKLAIFIHGCFWHGHAGCPRYRIPKTRTEYWTQKVENNKRRDLAARKNLRALGWKALIIWECETKRPKKLSRLIEQVLAA
ncbi:MAG: very short patch repair endonuclease [Rhodospirillales bacterium]|nr:very short patch repair endonuclease [Rhodospirillales bacterium]